MRGDTIATIATYLHRFVDRETLQTHYGAIQRLEEGKDVERLIKKEV